MNTKMPTLFCLKNPMAKQSKLHNYLRLTLISLLSLFSALAYAAAPVIRGDFNVSGGQATYSLPIEVVPGRNGHQPTLAISYASDSPNGYLGMGWNLSGLSSITRCGKNLAKDGLWGGVRLNDNDRYCLDGQRLVAISGKDGGHLTEYRLENNGFSKIVSFKTNYSGHGPSHFKVWKKDGSVYEYGMANTAQVNLPGQSHIYKWALNKITDHTKSNHIEFKYYENNGAGRHRISSIHYMGGSVEFGYEARSDSTSQLLMGSKLTRPQRLSKIYVKNQSTQTVRNYSLSYVYSTGTSRSLLTSVKKCTGSGMGDCSNQIKFNWTSDRNTQIKRTANTHIRDVNFFDVQRDGKNEYFGRVSSTQFRNLSGQAKNISSSTYIGLSGSLKDIQIKTSNVPLGSYDAHGIGALTTYDSRTWYSGDLNGDGKEEKRDRRNLKIEKTGDLDNDGKDDIYFYSHGARKFYYYLASNSHRESAIKLMPNTESVRVTDINNDGYKDLVTVERHKSNGAWIIFYLFNGSTYSYDTEIVAHHNISDIRFFDYNADGYPDLYTNKNIHKNNFGRISWGTYLRTGIQNFSGVTDLNFDGRTDLVLGESSKVKSVQVSKPYAQDKIQKITEEGLVYSISYRPASDASVHKQKQYFHYPVINSTPTRYLVSHVSKKPHGYSATTYDYLYEGAKSHRKGLGFLGFDKITVTENSEIKTITESEFTPRNSSGVITDLRLAGKPTRITVKKNGKIVKDTHFQSYHAVTRSGINGVKYYETSPKVVKVDHYDNNGNRVKTTTTTTEKDKNGFGNVVEKTTNVVGTTANSGSFTTKDIFDYVSNGTTQTFQVLSITSTNVPNIDTVFNQFTYGITKYCGTDGKVYVKPNDQFVLIHGDIDVPLILKRMKYFYRFDVSTSSNSQNWSDQQGSLVKVSEATFNAAKPKSCGALAYQDFNGDGRKELTSSHLNVTQLVTKSGSEFWQVGAIKKSTQSITDNTSGDVKTTVSDFEYTAKGLLSKQTITPTAYQSGSVSGRNLITRYGYDDFGNITSQSVSGSDLDLRTTSTVYDSNQLYIDKVTNAKGHVTDYTYDASGRLTEEIAPNGRKVTYQYDSFGRLIKETHPGTNNFVAYGYLNAGAEECGNSDTETLRCVKTIPNPGGESWVQLDFAGREVRSGVTSFDGRIAYTDTRWDRNGRKTSVTRPYFINDPVFHVEFEYDTLNREILKKEPSATGGQTLWRTNYNTFTTTLTDARGFDHKTTTNVLGHILKKEEAVGKPDYSYQTYTYFPDGKLKSSVDSKGNSTHVEYDNLGYRSKLDDPDLGVWAYKYNAAGELLEKTDANSVTTTYRYDSLGRKVYQKDGSSAASTWVYDGRGKTSLGALTSMSGHGSNSEFYYHANGLLAEKATFIDGEKFSTLYGYDDFERLKTEVRPNGLDSSSVNSPINLASATKASNRLALEYLYNDKGYLALIRSPYTYADTKFSHPSYRAEIDQLIKETLNVAKQYLNKAERYAQQKDFFQGKANEYNSKTIGLHHLDSASLQILGSEKIFRLKRWCDANGKCYLRPGSWVILHDDVAIPIDITLDGAIYELQQRLGDTRNGVRNYHSSLINTGLTDSAFKQMGLNPAGDFRVVDYDKNGTLNLMAANDAFGARADSSTQQELVFSAEDLQQAADISNRHYLYYTDLAKDLLKLVDKVQALSNVYCEAKHSLVGNSSEAPGSVNCQNKAEEKPNQLTHLKSLYTNSELAEASQSGAYQIYWQRRETDAYGHTLSETLGNGLVNTYYHSASTGKPMMITTHKTGQVLSHRYKEITGKQNAFVGSSDATRWLEYQYDDHNNVTQRYDQSLGIRDFYTYDGLDRVKTNNIAFDNGSSHANVTKNSAFSYDSIGNILNKTGVSGTYEYSSIGAGPHAVSKANGLAYQYDSVGNMVSAKRNDNSVERTLSWTAFNKPSEITRNGKTVTFSYDANHNRYKKVSGSQTTVYIDKTYERVTDVSTGEVQHQHFVYAEGKLIALNSQSENADGSITNKQVRFLHYDALNSVDMITDLYGYVVESRSYDAFGKQRDITPKRDTNKKYNYVEQMVLTNRGYTGHEEIEEVGLIHMNGRVYDQTLGRFVSADPIIQAPFVTNSFNRYAYVWNNPLKYIDPTGFEINEEWQDVINNKPHKEGGYESDRYDHGNGGTTDNGTKHDYTSDELYGRENKNETWRDGTADLIRDETYLVNSPNGTMLEFYPDIYYDPSRVNGVHNEVLSDYSSATAAGYVAYGTVVSSLIPLPTPSKASIFGRFFNWVGSKLGVTKGLGNFADQSKLLNHFAKHGGEFGAKNADEYLSMARDVMQGGAKVKYAYKGETRTGFVQFMGTNRKGQAKFAFVGTNRQGQITTLHTKSGNDVWKTLNGNAKDKVIRPVE
ncbi:putative Rhs family protein fused with Integrin alpha N-terminal domain [Vibrio nigripulchritudo MADA3029]|uniref:RHS repeat-associated core domain-containing protein n=1 Tax=Vibrio nigripulchritudo TaxID=28173 RepID=UPI0003B1F51C|nr:RHS repeat-associated core domain-containing protein [Vibrio nigripulchritudo]CCN48800.1 putative Rhs family protein fused with Integrin alpha N-terminal domain [Vibrio nigripulchritudo MADA3020]CCN54059.1 putative Rhs family protein fused with Integrin alpha N-terminal domain [Vibrio nigripulchritudo MADA3021]CCN60921.1 putative Rhs family protein fused with Integrin alpha N-terminal domain [Vibrio nigripulchritudo MADA3029]